MKIIKTRKLSDGKEVYLTEEGYGMWIFSQDDEGDFDETTGQAAPRDVFDREYTHGTRRFREACQKLDVL